MSGGGQPGGQQPQMQPFNPGAMPAQGATPAYGSVLGQPQPFGAAATPQPGALGPFNPTNPGGGQQPQPSNPAGGGKGQSPQTPPNYGWNANTLAPSNVQAQTPGLYGGQWNQLSQLMAGPQYSPVAPTLGPNQYLGNPTAQTGFGGLMSNGPMPFGGRAQ